jgi:hypothetical protein
MRVIIWAVLTAAAVGWLPEGPQLRTYVINLDDPPEQRWTHVISERVIELRALLEFVDLMLDVLSARAAKELVDAVQLPEEMQREIHGIAAAGNVTYRQVLTANMFYEISEASHLPASVAKSCTSIVAQHANGSVILARNQDYPTLFRALLLKAEFRRNGRAVYVGTTYAGTVGLSTGMSMAPSASPWAFSINARHAIGSSTVSTGAAVAAAKAGGMIFPVMPRLVLDQSGENATRAGELLATRKLILPGYVIFAGSRAGQGAVMTRNVSGTDTDVWALSTMTKDGWWRLETNYDREHSPDMPPTRDPFWHLQAPAPLSLALPASTATHLLPSVL